MKERSYSSGHLSAIGCRSGALQPRPRPAPALDESPHARQRCGWDAWKASDELFVSLLEGSFASDGGDGTGVPGFVIVGQLLATSAGGLLQAVDGPKGRDGDHDDGDACFDVVPGEQPDRVERAVVFEAGSSDDGGECHEQVQGEEDADDEFLMELDADGPEEVDGYDDDHEICGDVEGHVGDGQGKGDVENAGSNASC